DRAAHRHHPAPAHRRGEDLRRHRAQRRRRAAPVGPRGGAALRGADCLRRPRAHRQEREGRRGIPGDGLVTDKTLLDLEDVHADYAGIPAVRGVSLSVERGEIVALIGANGAGKTTLLRLVAGLKTPSTGRIRLDGAEIRALPPQAIVRRGLSLVPQDRGL